MIEPRKIFTVAGADAVPTAEGSIGWAENGLAHRSRRGRRAGHARTGVPQEPGKPCRLHVHGRNGATGITNPRPTACATRGGGSGQRPDTKGSVADVVSPSEGNEVRRDGRQGLGASHSTCEAGESHPWRPCGGKGMPDHRTVGEKHDRPTEAWFRVHETTTDSNTGQASSHDELYHAGTPH